MTARMWRLDGPGTFRHPDGVTTVTDRHGHLWRRSGPRWTSNGRHYVRWYRLVADHGPLIERKAA